ncbi:MAG: hypothetical protein PHH00_00065 [Candidatus Nanoarchaeia archaeon]|nr:hypothetical protein [Candidatus Nanoarchaeia archaeon]
MLELIRKAESLCIDADDTTAGFFAAFLDYNNARYGTSFNIGDFGTHRFHLVLGCTEEEAKRRVDEFQHSSYFKKILPLEGAVEAINRLFILGKKLYVATARADYTRANTERFYETYFRGMIQDIFFSSNNHTGRANSGKSKLEISRDLRAPLIDDDLEYVIPCAKAGFGGILFGDYRWQIDSEIPSNVPRAKNWKEVLKS